MSVTRRRVVALLVLALAAAPVLAGERGGPGPAGPVKVGVLKLTSSAPIFVGVEKGFFKEFGVEPELVYFQAAAPIATALAAGQLDVGATGLTAALYNIVLGGEKLWIVADKGREWPGYPLVAIVVQKELWDGGLRSIRDLKGKRIGVTQLGSTFHYHIGNILEKEGLALADVRIVPLQAMAATDGGAQGQAGRRDPGAAAVPGVAAGGAGLRHASWRGPATSTLADRHRVLLGQASPRTGARGGLHEGLRRRRRATTTTRRWCRRTAGPPTGRPTRRWWRSPRSTRARGPRSSSSGFPFQDRNGRLLVPDIERQMAWWVANGFMKRPLPLRASWTPLSWRRR